MSKFCVFPSLVVTSGPWNATDDSAATRAAVSPEAKRRCAKGNHDEIHLLAVPPQETPRFCILAISILAFAVLSAGLHGPWMPFFPDGRLILPLLPGLALHLPECWMPAKNPTALRRICPSGAGGSAGYSGGCGHFRVRTCDVAKDGKLTHGACRCGKNLAISWWT
jgi:hypothetical protein